MMYRAVALCALVLLVVAPNYSQAQKADLNSNGSNPATNSAAASSPAINPGKPLAAEVAAKGNNVAAASPAQKPSVTPLTASNSAPGAAPNSAQPAALQTAAVKGQQQPGQHAAPALAAPAAKQDQQQQQTALAQQATLAVEPAPNAETLGLELDELMSTNAPIIIQSADDLTNAALPASEFSQDTHTLVYVPSANETYSPSADESYRPSADGSYSPSADESYSPSADESYSPQKMPHSGKAAKKMYKYGDQYVLADDLSYSNYGSAALNQAVTYGSPEETVQSKQDRLQKYFVGDEAELTSELEQDSEVSSFAWPTGRYSSKAAKYAAAALKAQAGKPAAGGRALVNARTKQLNQPVKQQGLAGLTAGWLKNKQSGEDAVQSGMPRRMTGAVAAPAAYAQQGMLATPDLRGQQYAQALENDAFANKVFYHTVPGNEQYMWAGMKKRGKYAAQPAAGYIQSYGHYSEPVAPNHHYPPGNYSDNVEEYYDSYYPEYDYDDAPPKGKKEPKSVYDFYGVKGHIDQNVGRTLGKQDDSGPLLIDYRAQLTCGRSDRIAGSCRISGSIMRPKDSQSDNGHVYVTCELNPDVSHVCGHKYIPGMHITAQGLVDVTLSDGGYEIEKMDGGMLPITGTYTPYQKDTLLGDVLAVLHGIKGGSLSFNTQDNSTAFFSFLLYK